MQNKIILKPGQKIRTLGLYQPYATLMLHGKIETRFVGAVVDKKTRKKKYRKPPFPFGKYLIYATQKKYTLDEATAISGESEMQKIFAIQRANYIADFLIIGEAICVGDLVAIIDPLTEDTKNTFVQYVAPTEDGRRVGLVFQNVERIQRFPFKGKQGVGFLTDAEVDKIFILQPEPTQCDHQYEMCIDGYERCKWCGFNLEII